MEKPSNKLQVEILSPSNVLSAFSNNKITSYLSTKNTSAQHYDFGKDTPSTLYTAPKSTLNAKFLEGNSKTRGISAEASSLMTSGKKEPENVYFFKSPLGAASNSKKNFSFNNYMNENEANKKFDFEQRHMKSVKQESNNRLEVTTSTNFKLVRNNSMNKLGNNAKSNNNEMAENQKASVRRAMENKNYDIDIFTPKTFLMNNNAISYNNVSSSINSNFPSNTRDGMMLSPKQTKMEKVYEQIRLFQSNKKKKEEITNEHSKQIPEEKKTPYNISGQLSEKKDTFIKVLNEASNTVNSMKHPSNRNELTSKMKMLSPLNSDDLISSTPSAQTSKNIKRNEEFDKIYNEYNNNKSKKGPNSSFPSKENDKTNENSRQQKSSATDKLLERNDKTYENSRQQKSSATDKLLEKSSEETNEYKRLQEKLNVLEKKILSIKNNYDLTLKKNDKQPDAKKPPIKKSDFVSSSCNFYDASSKEKEKSKETTSLFPNGSNHKPKKISLEISNPNNNINVNEGSHIKFLNEDIETTKKSKTKSKEDNSPLNTYVTQVKPHSIFPNNVYEDLTKNLNISEISIKNESGRETPKNYSSNSANYNQNHKKIAANVVKASVFKLLFKSDVYYIGSVIKAFFYQRSAEQEIWKEHFHQTMQAILFTKFLKYPEEDVLEAKKIMLPKKDCYRNKKTLIFDLDETLIHCNENCEMESDVILPVKFPNGAIVQAGINLRPGIKECLKELSKHYEIIVFTASHSCYANVVLNYLDPQNEYIQHKLSRENCIVTKEGLYIKDLRILKNRDLRDVLIVDNAAYSFGFQLENGIPVLPFYKDKSDSELKNLTNYLLILKDVQDIREINSEVFKMNRYCEFNDPYELIKSLYNNYMKA